MTKSSPSTKHPLYGNGTCFGHWEDCHECRIDQLAINCREFKNQLIAEKQQLTLILSEDDMSNGPEFYQTNMGHKFYEGDVPRILDALQAIAKELRRMNDREEQRDRDREKGRYAEVNLGELT